MNYNEFINTFKQYCLEDLDYYKKERNLICAEIDQVRDELQELYRKRPISAMYAGCVATATMISAFLSSFFDHKIGLILGGVTVVTGALGLLQEKRGEKHQEIINSTDKYWRDLHVDYDNFTSAMNHCKSLLYDISRCNGLYLYTLTEEQQRLPINIDIDETLKSRCHLSTFLDQYYNGKYEEFMQLPEYEKQKVERLSNLPTRINEGIKKHDNNEQPLPYIRRRRADKHLIASALEDTTTPTLRRA